MCDQNRKLFAPDEQVVMDAYGWRCVLCGFTCATVLHHEPPRSLNPQWKEMSWTQFPLCPYHHDVVQDMPREDAKELLLAHEFIFAQGAIEKIKSRFRGGA